MFPRRLIYRLLFTAAVALCLQAANAQAQEGFRVKRGVNINHWLAQTGMGRSGRAEFFTEKDVAFIAGKGFDHIRIPVDESELWNFRNEPDPDAFALLHKALGWCEKHKLRVVVDLHRLRSQYLGGREKPLWTKPAAQERFLDCWRELSRELKKYPVSLVAYELLNGPVADSAGPWNNLLSRCIQVIREQEPERVLVVGSNQMQDYSTFPQLRVPPNDRFLMLGLHYYNPVYFTFYQAKGTKHQAYSGPVHYPGPTITNKELNEQPASIRNLLPGSSQEYNAATIQQQVDVPLQVARQLQLPLYCGEWGCLNTVRRKDRLRWYRDVKKVLEAGNIAWAVWEYKGSFGIVDENGVADDKLIKLLTGK